MSNIGQQLLSMGTGIVGNAANTALGIMFGRSQEKHNDARQLAQQQKLQELQIAGQKQMTDYNFQKQLDMWNATNYEAQIKHMKSAGVNPALAYGLNGAGGATASVTPGNVTGTDAPKGGHESYDQQAMGIQFQQQAMQLQLLEAQKKNIEADTANKQADTTKTAGVDTKSGYQGIEESKARQQLLEQNLDNERQRFEIGKLNITLQNIVNFEQQATQKDRMDYIEYQTKQAMKQLDNITSEAYVNKATINDKIKIIQQEAIGAAIRNGLMEAQTEATNAETKKKLSDIMVNNQQIKVMVNQIMQNWDLIGLDREEIGIKRQLMWEQTDEVNKAMDRIFGSIHGIMHIFPTQKRK